MEKQRKQLDKRAEQDKQLLRQPWSVRQEMTQVLPRQFKRVQTKAF